MEDKPLRVGDLHGRSVPASDVELRWEGNEICALVGPNLKTGVFAFGDSVHEALAKLAENVVREAVQVEINDSEEMPPRPADVRNCAITTNVIELYRSGNRTCARAAPDESGPGVAAFGDSVHEALRNLARSLVAQGVWIAVTNGPGGVVARPGDE
jgi:predicted RNase H-like HicB family nuclease